MRGLISPLSGVRPLTRNVVVGAINELLDSNNPRGLRPTERRILEEHLARLSPQEARGIDWRTGSFSAASTIGEREMPITFNLNFGAMFEFSSAFIPAFDETHTGMEFWIHVDAAGDIGRHLSYGFYNHGGLVRMPRRFLGMYNTYYEGFVLGGDWDPNEFVNRKIRVYSEPLTHFPFSYRPRWDGSVYFLDTLAGRRYWPYTLAGGYGLHAELTASFLENRFIMRLGRLPREWGSMPLGTSLAFNRMARPFLAGEMEFNPFPWLSFASLTGILEYHNTEGIKVSSMTNQNAFSITMLQLRFRNIVFFDFIDAVVWPKRFELGYIAPIINSFFYQDNIGDFDNMALAANLRLQYPGLGNVWVSLFVDEMNFQRQMPNLDRTMIAYQAGINVALPFLSFSSLRFSYTKINPYTFTHNRNLNPWFGDLTMETAWMNHGFALGHYLPPNSDEFLVQFRTMPAWNLMTVFQYQLIRRGANFGSSAVDGSHLLSELDPHLRQGPNPVLWRFFLRDGAYQWNHVIRASADWRLPNLPISLFGSAGVIISYFTNIFDEDGNPVAANNADLAIGEQPRPHSFRRINTPEYPRSTSFIATIGFRIFR